MSSPEHLKNKTGLLKETRKQAQPIVLSISSNNGLHFTKGETHLQLTQPLWEKLSSGNLKTIRIFFAIVNTLTAIFDASYTGWKPFIWYFSDWCLLLSLLTQWGLVLVHFFPFHPGLSNKVNFLLQVTIPLEVSMTLLFWLFFYTWGSIHFSDTSTYVHPIFLYLTPALFLLIELSLNSVIFNIKNLLWALIIYLVYVPWTYFGKYFLGYFPYSFITWKTVYSFVWLGGLGLLHVFAFCVITSCNNKFKTQYVKKIEKREQFQRLD